MFLLIFNACYPIPSACVQPQTVANGFATAETAAMLSAAHIMAVQLAMRLDDRRKAGALSWLGPDGLVQVGRASVIILADDISPFMRLSIIFN